MRVYLTGATGFLGSNVVRVLSERHGGGVELFCPTGATPAPDGAPYDHAPVDLTDPAAVARSVADVRPDAIVHGAIWNDLVGLTRDRRRAWASYVGATRALADAAAAADAHLTLVSTDWVFDGTQVEATEDEPPNPVNAYGFLKAASELVVREHPVRAAVARVSGVQGVHWARPATPRAQDAGFGYLVASLADALRAGRRFRLWDHEAINVRATPTLAGDAAELLWRIADRGLEGTLHCCAASAVTRRELAGLAIRELGLDADLLDVGEPDWDEVPDAAIPHDTSLSAAASAERLGVSAADPADLVRRLGRQLDTGELAPQPGLATSTTTGGAR